MNKLDRIQRIIDIVRTEGNATIKYLARLLNVSEATVRRDLRTVCSSDTVPVKRIKGGILYSLEKLGYEPMFDLKVTRMVEAKKKIARTAVDLLEDGDTLALDSGTTIYYFARLLGSKRGLKVIATDLKVAEELAKSPCIQTIIVCGEVRPGYFSIGGIEAVKFLSLFHVDKVFISTDAWTLEGTFNSSSFEAEVKRTLLKLASKKYLLADHTKFGKKAFIKVSDINVFDAIITDQNPPPDVLEELKSMGVNVVCAKDDSVDERFSKENDIRRGQRDPA